MNSHWINYNFLTVSQGAAIACAPLRGKLDKNKADEKATNAMRTILQQMPIKATVVIGEGEMDEAPMLYIGEELGKGGVELDIAVDPLDGTTITSKNQENAITVISFTDRGGFLNAPDMYMKKIVVGHLGKGAIDIKKSLTENLKAYATQSGKAPQDITVCMLDRDRHIEAGKEVLAFGATLKLISDCDILPAILTGIENSGIDMLYGIGAAPEGVIAAAGIKCLGGDFQGMLMPSNDEEINRAKAMGVTNPETQVFLLNDIVKTDNIVVVMTAVTDGFIGKGVEFCKNYTRTHSLKISSNPNQRIQFIQNDHFDTFKTADF